MSTHSDIIIIGAGPGGYETALDAAARGRKVTLINGGKLGGTCLNEGCIPTKCMVKDAAVVDTCRNALEFGVKEVSYEIDFNKVIERREAVVSQLREGVAGILLVSAALAVLQTAQLVELLQRVVPYVIYGRGGARLAVGVCREQNERADRQRDYEWGVESFHSSASFA